MESGGSLIGSFHLPLALLELPPLGLVWVSDGFSPVDFCVFELQSCIKFPSILPLVNVHENKPQLSFVQKVESR